MTHTRIPDTTRIYRHRQQPDTTRIYRHR